MQFLKSPQSVMLKSQNLSSKNQNANWGDNAWTHRKGTIIMQNTLW